MSISMPVSRSLEEAAIAPHGASEGEAPILSAARRLVEGGYQLTLLYGTDPSGVCLCSEGTQCKSAGKHPRARGWARSPIRSAAELQERWLRAGGSPNIGIVPDSGLVVIDVDRKKGRRGGETLAALELK